MKLSVGIIGLPNVGKSTLFKILTSQEVNIANYAFTTINPNRGAVTVPDERLNKLGDIFPLKKRVAITIEFYDIAGLVKNAHKGEGLGNQFLSHIREVNAIIEVVRLFNEPVVSHVEANINPLRDIEIIYSELIFKDLETLDKRLNSLEKEIKTGDKQKIIAKGQFKDLEILKIVRDGLNKNTLVELPSDQSNFDFPRESAILKELNLLTAKPKIYLLNGSENDITPELKEKLNFLKVGYIVKNLAENPPMNDLIKSAYNLLDLISFFTIGDEEIRAWTIKKGTKASCAAGVIHTDFEKNFIKAEIIDWEKLVELGSLQAGKNKGFIRLEGRDYEIKDGEVVFIRHT
ncbi:MAG: YchF family ATPase [Candidatus Liptonbacteria bacterium]|nr:YchF family ATPase [Candidatus Liptonbacteria bacterium]